ncbi:MAG: hypothetical protein R2759_12565 [Bacteroidales bacterium]
MLAAACSQPATYDIIIKNGHSRDRFGSGYEGFQADIGIHSDTIAFIGDLSGETADEIIDASGLVVGSGLHQYAEPGPRESHDGSLAQSDIRQGVTLEVLGEGWSMGPWNDGIKKVEERGLSKGF